MTFVQTVPDLLIQMIVVTQNHAQLEKKIDYYIEHQKFLDVDHTRICVELHFNSHTNAAYMGMFDTSFRFMFQEYTPTLCKLTC